MDGTTAGNLGSVFPLQPRTTPVSGNLLNVAHDTPVSQLPSVPQFPSPITAPIQNSLPPVETTTPMPNSTDYEAMENSIQDLDFDQMVWAGQPVGATTEAPLSFATPPIPASTPTVVPTVLSTPPPVVAPVQTPLPPLPVAPAMPVLPMPPRPTLVAVPPRPVVPFVSTLPPPPVMPAPLPVEVTPTPIVPITPTAAVVPQPAPFVTPIIPDPDTTPIVIPPTPVAKDETKKDYFATPASPTTPITATTPTAMIPAASMGSSKSGPSISPQLLRRIVIIAGVVIVLGVGGFFVVHALTGAHKSQTTSTAKTTATTTAPQPDFSQPTATTDAPSDTTTTAPAATDPSTAPADGTTTLPTAGATTPTVANTAVSDDFASLPGYLDITKLNIHAPVEQVSTTASGAMGVPSNIWNAGWYTGSSRPGQAGAAFIDGHSSSAGGALFGQLDTLVAGDTIKVERNDGIAITYKVAKVSVVNRNNVDMASMLKPYDAWKNGLNIMSCEGPWVASENTLENRVLVYAVQT